MNTFEHIGAVATENQQRMAGDRVVSVEEEESRGAGGGGGAGNSRTRTLASLKEASMTSMLGRTSTFSDTMSDSDASATLKRLPPHQRDRMANFISLKRGSALYFGKDITTSMWWKYGGVNALHDRVGDGKAIYENSHQMEPKSGRKFAPGKVEDCIRAVLAIHFEKEIYHPRKAVLLTETISDAVKEKVKGLVLERYRLIVNVDIGSRMPGQEVIFASRFLWNTDTDGFATVTHQNRTMYVVVTVYGVYLD